MKYLGQRVEVCAAEAVHDALGLAGRAAGVVDRDRVVLSAATRPQRGHVGVVEQAFVVERADGGGRTGAHSRQPRREAIDQTVELVVVQQQRRAAVAQDVIDLVGREPGVERAQHAARQRDGIRRLEHHRRVGREHGDPLARAHPHRLQRGGEPAHALDEHGVGAARGAVDHGDLVGIDERGPFEKVERVERAQMDRDGRFGDHVVPFAGPARFSAPIRPETEFVRSS